MDSCFNIPELVLEICSHCYRSELAALGCTARLFDCALDLLWRELTGEYELVSLFKSLSLEVVNLVDDEDGEYQILSLLNPIEQRHWERFQSYAKRIRSLDLCPWLFHPILLDALNLWAPLGGILPNLRTLNIAAPISEPLFLRLFPCPKLEVLCLALGPVESDRHALVASATSALPAFCPGLASLHISVYARDPIFPQSLMTHLPNLRMLTVNGMLPAHFAMGPSLSKLTQLFLSFKEGSMPPGSSEIPPVCFLLEQLRIKGSAEQILGVFNYIYQSPIKYLYLVCTFGTLADVKAIARVVADRCRRDTLQEIIIQSPGLSRSLSNSTVDPTASRDCLAPFFVFPNVKRFQTSLLPRLYPEDAFVATLAKSWPKLVSLKILCCTNFPPISQYPKLTTRCLGLLALHCPHLSQLGIEFDATIVDSPDPDELLSPRGNACVTNSLLQTLNVGHSPIDSIRPIAAYLSRIFPQLKAISRAHFPGPTAPSRKWAKVEEMILSKPRETEAVPRENQV